MSKILIIEDSPTNMKLVVAVLKNVLYPALQPEDAIAGIRLVWCADRFHSERRRRTHPRLLAAAEKITT